MFKHAESISALVSPVPTVYIRAKHMRCIFTTVFMIFCTSHIVQSQESAKPNLSILAKDPDGALSPLVDAYSESITHAERMQLCYELNVYQQTSPATRKLIETYKIYCHGNTIVAVSDHIVYVSTDRRAFILHRVDTKKQYSIARIYPIFESQRSVSEMMIFETFVQGEAKRVFRPFASSRAEYGLFAFIAPGYRKITQTKLLDSGSIQVSTTSTSDNIIPGQLHVDASCILDSSCGFAPSEGKLVFSEVNVPKNSNSTTNTTQLQFQYVTRTENMPLTLKSLTEVESQSGRPTSTNVYEFSNYKIESVPPEMLTLEYYGVVDPIEKPFVWWPYALVALGLVGIGVYFFLRLRAKAKAA